MALSLVLAGAVGCMAMFVIAGSRRVSDRISAILKSVAPVFALSCCAGAVFLRRGQISDIVVLAAWSVVGGAIFSFVVSACLGWLRRRDKGRRDDR